MKLPAIALVVFVLSLVGVTLATRPPSPTVAAAPARGAHDSAAAQPPAGTDSVRRDSVADRQGPEPAASDTTPGPVTPPTPPAPAVPADRPAAAAPPGPGAAAAHVTAPDQSTLYHRLARIIATMNPQDAAGVLAKMTNDEVTGILSQLGTRPAASLLASLPKERAALISQRLLTPGRP
ncbi:MAG TPA: hypothetical protein VMT21_03915 [Gemmatimonadales bacterium]|nr:hypothetical protein [Gemmatimonadales bacterium]